MTALKEFYCHVFDDEWFGVVTGTSTAQSFPSGTAHLARFKAGSGNQGDIFIGNEADTVFPLDGGDDTGWFAPRQGKLENYWYTAENDEVLYWWVQR